MLNDELHAQENMDMYDNLKSAQVSREQPMMLNISTAGKGSSSVGMRVYKLAKEALEKIMTILYLLRFGSQTKGMTGRIEQCGRW